MPITAPGICKLLKKIQPDKASGPDGIAARVMKELAEETAPILTLLFQSSLDQGSLPDDWKNADVVHIFQEGLEV